PYDEIVSLLSRRFPNPLALPPPVVLAWVRAFSLVVSSLTPGFSSVVDAILSLDWETRDDAFGKAYSVLLQNLVSAHAIYVIPVAKVLMKAMRCCKYLARARCCVGGDRTIENEVSRATLYDRAHFMLRRVLSLIPTGPSFMLPIITENFPHKREALGVHVHYLRNLLRIIEYAPVISAKVLALIVDRVVQIDVEIQVELEDLDEDIWDEVQQKILALDPRNANGTAAQMNPSSAEIPDPDEDDDMNFDSDDDDDDAAPMIVDFRIAVEKLDAMLRILFQYLEEFKATRPQPALRELFDDLVAIFVRTVLPTHKLRCTQFLWFYACSLDPTFPDLFLGMLIQTLFEQGAPTALRVSATAYLGSFIARARYVSLDSVRMCLRLLHQYALGYVDEADAAPGMRALDIERHAVFYASVQAVVYVFCFRWKQLMYEADGRALYGQLPAELAGFQKTLMCKLSPMRVCSRTIVTEFARLTHKLDIMYCYPLIDRRTVTQSALLPASGTSHPFSTPPPDAADQQQPDGPAAISDRLDAFFPFDPISLPVSRNYVDSLYQAWVGEDEDERSEE
ncbi:RNA polymerase I-specific transcription initiation factor RRN3, partial [Blyttiomyces helicus]